MPKKVKNRTVYEYFRESSEIITGKYADYADAMWKQGKIGDSYFDRLVDLYTISAAVGIVIRRSLPEDTKASGDKKRSIQLDQLTNCLPILSELMRIVLIIDDSRGLTLEEKLDAAFRVPETEEVYKENMKLFNSYVRGGMEYLYENLVARPLSVEDEDYGDARVSNIIALLKGSFEKEIIE